MVILWLKCRRCLIVYDHLVKSKKKQCSGSEARSGSTRSTCFRASRIRIRIHFSQRYGSGSIPKCHGSGTLEKSCQSDGLFGARGLAAVHEHVELKVGALAELGPALWAARLSRTPEHHKYFIKGGFFYFFIYFLCTPRYSTQVHLPSLQIPQCRRMLGSNPGCD